MTTLAWKGHKKTSLEIAEVPILNSDR